MDTINHKYIIFMLTHNNYASLVITVYMIIINTICIKNPRDNIKNAVQLRITTVGNVAV